MKSKVDYKCNELPDFLKKLKEVIDEQDEEVSRAVIGKGKYVIRPGFKQLEKVRQSGFQCRKRLGSSTSERWFSLKCGNIEHGSS